VTRPHVRGGASRYPCGTGTVSQTWSDHRPCGLQDREKRPVPAARSNVLFSLLSVETLVEQCERGNGVVSRTPSCTAVCTHHRGAAMGCGGYHTPSDGTGESMAVARRPREGDGQGEALAVLAVWRRPRPPASCCPGASSACGSRHARPRPDAPCRRLPGTVLTPAGSHGIGACWLVPVREHSKQ
jgi:hypothetical protein